MSQAVVVLGSTGSIGCQTLDVMARHADDYHLHALTAGRNWQRLAQQCLEWRPRYAVLADKDAASSLRNHLRDAKSDTQVLAGDAAIAEVAAAAEAELVVAAIVGAAGMLPSLAAVKAGKRVLLANKEALVVAGEQFMRAVREHDATLLPLDSEHSAIFQCLPDHFVCNGGGRCSGVDKLLLTASGGPFRATSAAELADVTLAQALNHPNWDMGPKITIDSATLMNKGLELIEACWLFGVTPDDIEVVVHPQSVIHSMVQYQDGAVLAQLGTPDMRAAIALGLSWPERIESGASRLSFSELASLTFEAPDEARFPCLALARAAMQSGGTATAVLNAANEEAVAAFLDERIGFMEIPRLVERALERVSAPACDEVAEIMQVDRNARAWVRHQLGMVSS